MVQNSRNSHRKKIYIKSMEPCQHFWSSRDRFQPPLPLHQDCYNSPSLPSSLLPSHLTKTLPPCRKVQAVTVLVCPCNQLSSTPFCTSHSPTLRSQLHEPRVRPSGENLTEDTASWWPRSLVTNYKNKTKYQDRKEG